MTVNRGMQQVNEKSTYLEAFEVSKRASKLIYKIYLSGTGYEYKDFEQDCAVAFFGDLKYKYDAFSCCNMSYKCYKWVALNRLKKLRLEYNKYPIDVESLWCVDHHEELIRMCIGLSIKDWEIVDAIVGGYRLSEISSRVGYSAATVQTHITEIRRKIANYFGIADYSSMRRKYTIDESRKLIGSKHPRSKRCCAYLNGKLYETFESARQAEAKYGSGVFASIRDGYRCKGLVFRYAEAN